MTTFSPAIDTNSFQTNDLLEKDVRRSVRRGERGVASPGGNHPEASLAPPGVAPPFLRRRLPDSSPTGLRARPTGTSAQRRNVHVESGSPDAGRVYGD